MCIDNLITGGKKMTKEISMEEILSTLEKHQIKDYYFVQALMEHYLKDNCDKSVKVLLLDKIRSMLETSKEVPLNQSMMILEQTTVLGELYQKLDKLNWPEIQVRPETFYENIEIQNKEDLIYFVETCFYRYQELFEEYGVSAHAMNITRDIGEPITIVSWDFLYLMSFFKEDVDILQYLLEVYMTLSKCNYDKIVGLD